jgi:hypothetical protein
VYGDTQIGPDGKRVPREEAAAAAYDGEPATPDDMKISPEGGRVAQEIAEDQAAFDGEPDDGSIDPDTQINPEGERVPMSDAQAQADGPPEPLLGSEPESDPPDDSNPPLPAAEDDDDGPTLDELKDQARELKIKGRSSMNKDELAAAIEKAQGS